MGALVFILDSKIDWRRSLPDDWNSSYIELSGDEKFLGHKQIDGAICKIYQLADNRIIAIPS